MTQLNKRKLKQLTSADPTQTAAQRALLFDNQEHVGYKSDVYTNSYAPAQFFCINPLHSVIAPREVQHITANRNFLVEFDKAGWTLSKQEQLFEGKLQLPFATKTYSGGKSIHYIIALTESVDADTYYTIFQLLSRACNLVTDKQVNNTNRLSRTAGQLRDGVNRQELLALGVRVDLNDLCLKLANIMPIEYNRYLLEKEAKIKARAAAYEKHLNNPNKDYRLQPVFQRALDTGEYPHFRYESRHEFLKNAIWSMHYDFFPLEEIENYAYRLQDKIGLDRDDVSGIIKNLARKMY
jgi:hypothetical protein